ncbi:MAG: hypothetical protein RIS47_1177 [Bacteroidota bacterium]
MSDFSYLSNSGIDTIETMYKQYLEAPESVEDSWRRFFEGFSFAQTNFEAKPSISNNSVPHLGMEKEFRVIELINGYRQRGHLFTQTNPVRARRPYFPTMDLVNFGLSEGDLDSTFEAGRELGLGKCSLRTIVESLTQTYCQSIGVEYKYIRKPEMVQWLQQKMELSRNTPNFTTTEKLNIYNLLKESVGFEQYIHRKFVGQKRFSLEGAESLIPALDAVIEYGAELGIQEFILGMSHRGRLNVLVNIMQKPARNIFDEFLGKRYEEKIVLGDVKYHLGYGNDIVTKRGGKKVRLNLLPNPSHLETVGALVGGVSRAKLASQWGGDENLLAPIVIHGDAAVAAQGIVYEIVQMAQLPGYRTGGTIHIVVNNQVGFTTSYVEARSSTYCTDIAKVTRCPVFHVNADDP